MGLEGLLMMMMLMLMMKKKRFKEKKEKMYGKMYNVRCIYYPKEQAFEKSLK